MRSARGSRRRVRSVTIAATLLLTAAVGCGQTASDPAQTPETGSPPTTQHTDAYAAIAGTWRSNHDGKWVLHLKADRTFVQDFAGVKDMREGTYRIDGEKLTLRGGDGYRDRGTFDGQRITIRDFVFTRAK